VTGRSVRACQYLPSIFSCGVKEQVVAVPIEIKNIDMITGLEVEINKKK
jgi:hypothetical protein